MNLRWLNKEEFFPAFGERWLRITTVHLHSGGQFTAPVSQSSLTCCRLSTFLGIVKEFSHSGNEPDPYSLNIRIVAGSVIGIDDVGWLPGLIVGKGKVGWLLGMERALEMKPAAGRDAVAQWVETTLVVVMGGVA